MATTATRSWKKNLFICSLLVFTALTAVALKRWYPMMEKPLERLRESTMAQARSTPSVVDVRRGEVKKSLLMDGELRAVKSRTIFASSSEEGKITYLPPEGSLVKVGERLVELDNGTILGKIKDTEEKIVAAENEITNTRSQQESALRDMEIALSKLWMAYEQAKVKAQVPVELVSRREYQEAQLALEKSKTEYDIQIQKIAQKKKEQQAELQVKNIEKEKLTVELNQHKEKLDNTMIKAPAEGMVIYGDHWAERRKIQMGDVVWGGFPIVSLPDLNEMEVVVQINEVDGAKLSVGQKAKIVIDSYPDIEIFGAVKEVAQTAVKAGWNARAKIFKVVISMDKTVKEVMKPGMSARVTVEVANLGSQLLVPRQAVAFEGSKATVLKAGGPNNAGQPVEVSVISSDPLYYAIADNGAIKEGDRILSR